MVVPKPNNITDWIIWGDLTESVLIKYESNVWDKDKKDYYIDIEHRPTNLMRWANQIENHKESTYDKGSDTYKIMLPMNKVGLEKARTDGSYILMLCDFRGNTTNMVELINKRLWNENQKIKNELRDANAQVVRTQAQINQIVEHPAVFWKTVIKLQRKIGQGTAPAVLSKDMEGITPSPEE